MVHRRTSLHAAETTEESTRATGHDGRKRVHRHTAHEQRAANDEAHDEQTTSTASPTDEMAVTDERMQRAEELVDRMAERVGHYTAVLGHEVLKWTARAREEAEDIWAEAQAIRRRRTAK